MLPFCGKLMEAIFDAWFEIKEKAGSDGKPFVGNGLKMKGEIPCPGVYQCDVTWLQLFFVQVC
jgi:hypothetical protein